MTNLIDLSSLGLPPVFMILAAIGVGSLLAFYGVASALSDRGVAATRMAERAGGRPKGSTISLVRPKEATEGGVAAGLIGDDEVARLLVRRELMRAGFHGPHAVRNFILIRVFIGALLPGIFLLLLVMSQSSSGILPAWLQDKMNGLSSLGILLWLSILCFVGYVGPSHWLDRRIAERKLSIELAFPNALDLMQISVEAGLGFDAAMSRVALELRPVAPELAEEFLIAQSEIQAGRERQSALLSMAKRTGVDTVSSFVSVVLQSIQFGTPMGKALNIYSKEMRLYRELRAQEKANKLPVQMSAILASFMLPSIMMITLGPVVIRYIRYFAS
jgi:tight adherence protein C